MWLRTTEKRINHDMDIEREQVMAPARIAGRGQVFALLAVFGVLAVAVVAFVYGYPAGGTILGVVDLVALAGVFLRGQRGREQGESSS